MSVLKHVKKFLSLTLSSTFLSITPVSAFLPEVQNLSQFKDSRFCEKYAEEFCRKNTREKPDPQDKESLCMITGVTEEERKEFNYIFSELIKYDKNLAVRLILCLINYRILCISDDSGVKYFWSEVFRKVGKNYIVYKKDYSLLVEDAYGLKIEDFKSIDGKEFNYLLLTLCFRSGCGEPNFEILFTLEY